MFAGVSCVAPAGGSGRQDSALIYGEVDLVDVGDHPDPFLRQLARESVGGIVDRRLLSGVVPRTISVGEAIEAEFGLPYCEGEPFRDEPLFVECSGALIDDDLFLTASHCIPTQTFCDQSAIVFDWLRTPEGSLESIGPEDIYECTEIVQASYLRDVVIVRLDRPVSPPHRPLLVRHGSAPIEDGDPLTVIGHPLGMPMRIDDAAEARGAYVEGTESFQLRADVLPAHSGSPVLDEDGEVVGVLSRGPVPFVARSCVELATEADAAGEEVAGYVYRVMHDLCKKGPGSPRLCADPNVWCEDCGGGCSATGATSGSAAMLIGLLLLLHRRRASR